MPTVIPSTPPPKKGGIKHHHKFHYSRFLHREFELQLSERDILCVSTLHILEGKVKYVGDIKKLPFEHFFGEVLRRNENVTLNHFRKEVSESHTV